MVFAGERSGTGDTLELDVPGWRVQFTCSRWQEPRPMPSKKRKPKPFRAASAVKAAARAAIGTPPPTRTEPGDKKRKSKAGKHKPTLSKLLEESAD